MSQDLQATNGNMRSRRDLGKGGNTGLSLDIALKTAIASAVTASLAVSDGGALDTPKLHDVQTHTPTAGLSDVRSGVASSAQLAESEAEEHQRDCQQEGK
jgi:hypothetical protein